MIRMTLTLALAAFTLSCGGGAGTSPRKPDPNPTPGQVDLSIASVTLADDCGSPPSTAPTAGEMVRPEDRSQFASQTAGDRACQQSSVQLRVANGTAEPSTITVKKVELLDESGAVLRELTSRDASQWANDTYQAWDQKVGPNQVLQVSYSLSAPSASPGSTYTVRVTIAAGDGERTIEQKTTLQAEASLPAGAVT